MATYCKMEESFYHCSEMIHDMDQEVCKNGKVSRAFCLRIHAGFLAICMIVLTSFVDPDPKSQEAVLLADAMNEYRMRHGLPAIAISPSLTKVAEMHVQDLHDNRPDREPCNMHSWSSSSAWTPCCFTERSPKDECMWNKPREITRGRYSGYGYEIVAWLSDPIDPDSAIRLWEKSKGHHDMIMNRGNWSQVEWRAMGAAMSEHYAVVWFGSERDH